MRKIISQLFLIIMIIFISDKLIFITLNFFYKKTIMGEDGGELNNYLLNNDKIKLVLLGSSTTKLQVDPHDFNLKAINLAHHSTTTLYQSGILDIMLTKNKIPKAILLSISPSDFTISPYGKKEEFESEILFLKYYYNESSFVKENMNKIAPTERLKYFFWSYRFNGNIIKNFRYYLISRKNTNTFEANFSYQKSYTDDSVKVVGLLKELAKKPETEIRRLNSSRINSLTNIIETCKKYNITLLCYYMPMLSDRSQALQAGIQTTDSIMLANNIPYFKISHINFPQLFETSSYWVDLQHLNEKGGKIETKLLSKFVQDSLRN